MDWSQINRHWTQFKPKIKQKWNWLTEEDLKEIGGKRDVLENRIHERYRCSPDHVHKEVEDWLRWQTLKSRSRMRTDLMRGVSVASARSRSQRKLLREPGKSDRKLLHTHPN
jgi:uncharacterized protein YjbJ (UPF0337 family)